MKKLLIGFLMLFVVQGSLLLSYANIDSFYSDNAEVKNICKNNPKAFLWKSSIEKGCDCLDKGLGNPSKSFEQFVKGYKQDSLKHQLLDKDQLLDEFAEGKVNDLNKGIRFELEFQAIDTILFDKNDDIKNDAKYEYEDVFIKAFNQSFSEAKIKLKEKI